MKNQFTQLGAATPSESKLFEKKDANLKSNNVINFQIGLIAALLFAWLLVELTTEQVHVEQPIATITMPTEVEDDMGKITIIPNTIPVVKSALPEPPKPVITAVPPKIVVNTTTIPEPSKEPVAQPVLTLTSSSTTSSNAVTTKVKTPVIPAAPSTIPFNSASEAPLFPGCSAKMSNAERASCFNEKIGRFVQKNFDTHIANSLDQDTINFTVLFTINEHGEVIDVLVKSKINVIEKEAKRLMSRLPDMIPGKFNKQPVKVQYALPIVFNIR